MYHAVMLLGEDLVWSLCFEVSRTQREMDILCTGAWLPQHQQD